MKRLPGIETKRTVTRNVSSRDKAAAFSDPLAGSGRKLTSTHVTRTTTKASRDKRGGELIRGDEFRGYQRNEDRRRFSVEDATVAADGTNRVRDL